MPWAKFDDGYYDNPKLRRAGLAATGLHARAVTYCSKHLTDGEIDQGFVDAQLVEFSPRIRERVVAALVDEGLFVPIDGGFRVHDYLVYNDSKERVLAKRADAAERQAKRRGHGTSHAVTDPVTTTVSHDSLSRAGEERSSTTDLQGSESVDARELCDLLADLIVANDPKAKPARHSKGWLDAARLLMEADDRERTDVERVIRWCQADPFWRANILSMRKLREQFPQLWLKMRANEPNAERKARQERGFAAWDRMAGAA